MFNFVEEGLKILKKKIYITKILSNNETNDFH